MEGNKKAKEKKQKKPALELFPVPENIF